MRGVKESGKAHLLLSLALLGVAILIVLVSFLIHRERTVRRLRRNATIETNAVEHLRKIGMCQYAFRRQTGEYVPMERLGEGCKLLDERFRAAEPVVDGYVYRMQITPPEGDRPPFYSVNADPHEETGALHFYIDSYVVGLRQTTGRPATAADRQRK